MVRLATGILTFAICIAGSAIATSCTSPDTQSTQSAIKVHPVPAARFTDPDRHARLMSALPAIDSLFHNFAARSHVPGIAYGILIDGKLVHARTEGLRDIAANSPVDGNTAFRIASMTKSFTALAILKLRDEGKLSLDDPAEEYIPELAGLGYPTSDSPRITIRQLLSHAEGFPEDNPWGDRQLDKTDDEMSAMMTSGIPFSNPPGIAYEYSNYGFAILGRIVARVSGVSYSEYVSANILKPLQLGATTLHADSVSPANLAHGYRWEEPYTKSEAVEREEIAKAVASLRRTTGHRPLGWYSRYAPSAHTRRLLAEEGGFLYDSDSYADDLPYWTQVSGKPWLVVPYSLEANDIKFWANAAFATGQDFCQYLKDSLDVLWEEGAETPRMMSAGLHLRIIGRPGRAKALDDFIAYARAKGGVWFARRNDIATVWREQFPPPKP